MGGKAMLTAKEVLHKTVDAWNASDEAGVRRNGSHGSARHRQRPCEGVSGKATVRLLNTT